MSEIKVVRDEQGNAIVIIPDIIFWNKQDIDWDAVKEYLKKYLGEIIENKQTKEKIEIGTKFADEYTGSKYSEHIRGARAKAKANAAQGIRELVESAANKLACEELLRKNLGMILDVSRRSHMRTKIDNVGRTAHVVDSAFAL